MANLLADVIETITSATDAVRNRDEAALFAGQSRESLLRVAEGLEFFRKQSNNLYHRVRACLFLHAIYRYHLIDRKDVPKTGRIPYEGIRAALNREFDAAIELYRAEMMAQGCNEALLSALAQAYYDLAFSYLLDQVRQSVRTSRGNEWMFQPATARRFPLRAHRSYLRRDPASGLYPVGVDACPVRADPSHSGWSDIFFLGMDFPEGARVVNFSVDLAVRGKGAPVPPCECYCRFIEEPVIRLVSVDLACDKTVSTIGELFNFGNDHLSLIKAGVIASGVVPPACEKAGVRLESILRALLGRKGGFELVTRVRDIPKGSRLAVSTNLLATIITRLMRFSGQIPSQTGGLTEDQRRQVASRAILGEWLGGSGGGWQDSGGIWPGVKVIEGVAAARGDPEFGISRGRLLPRHTVLAREQLPADIEKRLSASIVIVHGGLSLNVGPILEMVTTRYLLRSKAPWEARREGGRLFGRVVEAIESGSMKRLGALCTRDWDDSTKIIIPWASNAFTEDLIAEVKAKTGRDYWGFLMLGGASGGGMAFLVDPRRRDRFQDEVLGIMQKLKDRYASALPFAMDPVVYDFKLNYRGVQADLLKGKAAVMPAGYRPPEVRTPSTRFARSGQARVRDERLVRQDAEADRVRASFGFDRAAQDRNKALLKSGKIGVDRNRLPQGTKITDVAPGDFAVVSNEPSDPTVARLRATGQELIRAGAVATVTYSGGLGSRWAGGAAIVKAINPFVAMKGRHRSFIELHLAKSQDFASRYRQRIQHVFTTSYLTHEPIARELEAAKNFGYQGRVYLSQGRSISQRVYPMERDLRFLWEELLQQKLDEQVQKVRDDVREALIEWARDHGEGEDYEENDALQRFNPPGHFFEIPNLLRNGTLARMLADNPKLKYLLAHNTDTTGVFLSPIMLGMHAASGKMASFEVTPRRFEDKGGGLARVNGRVQLVEALALPHEEDEFKLTYYNTLTTWLDLDRFLALLGLTRDDVVNEAAKPKVDAALHALESRVPTYVTIKEVRELWGAGQEDIFPVAQFEKLWGDITWLPEAECGFLAVERRRGQQLKEPEQLDRFVLDGSRDYVASKCQFTR
ncbi:MAG: UTP--glucose-1-phosphate uridylyltransferase [Candidatus Coatesbacteria bacterium]